MLKSYLTAFFLFLSIGINAQVHKVFIEGQDTRVSDSTKATSYILYEKLDGDSSWEMNQYTMNDTLLATGTFKDEKLTIGHGKFTYYSLPNPTYKIVYNPLRHFFDTVRNAKYLAAKGYYINGKKEGQWLQYSSGKLNNIYTFKHDLLDGPSKIYLDGRLTTIGNYKNGLRDGVWYDLDWNFDDTVHVAVFKNDVHKSGHDIKKRSKYFSGHPEYDIIEYLNSELTNNNFFKVGHFEVRYNFDLTVDGKLANPHIRNSDPEIDITIIDKLLEAPKWLPAYYTIGEGKTEKKKIVESRITFEFYVVIDKKNSVQISYPLHTNIRHDQEETKQ